MPLSSSCSLPDLHYPAVQASEAKGQRQSPTTNTALMSRQEDCPGFCTTQKTHHGGWGLRGVVGPQVVQVPVPPEVLQCQAVHEAHQVHEGLTELHTALRVRTLPTGVEDHQLQGPGACCQDCLLDWWVQGVTLRPFL
jgi:hypothetical protein